jgi:hypothetical protein
MVSDLISLIAIGQHEAVNYCTSINYTKQNMSFLSPRHDNFGLEVEIWCVAANTLH